MASNFAVFTQLFELIDERTMRFATEISGKIVSEITPIVVVGLTIAFIMHGLLIVRGMVDSPLMEFLGRSIRIALIVGIALGSGFYQGQIADTIRTLPDGLATALISDSGGTGATAAAVVDQAAGKGFEKAGEAWEQGNIFSGDGILYFGVGVLYLLFTVFVVAIGGSVLLLAKVGLSLLAGLGPMFIISLVWQPTTRFFEMWVAQLANYGLMVVLFSAIFGFMMDIYSASIDGVQINNVANLAGNLGGLGILSVAMIIILMQLPSLASGLAGGASMGALHEIRALVSGVKGAGKAAGGGAKAGGVGGKAALAGSHAALAGASVYHATGSAGTAASYARGVAKGYYKNKGGKKAA